MLSDKARKLLTAIEKRGGGVIEEYQLRDATGLSHGSIVAARQELVAAGCLQLGKSCRKLIYTLTGQRLAVTRQGDALTGQCSDMAGRRDPQARPLTRQAELGESGEGRTEKQLGKAKAANARDGVFFAPAMPHVAGIYYDFDEWTDALMHALGDCLDISESLVEDGAYTVYSHDFACEDTYRTETTSDGFVVV